MEVRRVKRVDPKKKMNKPEKNPQIMRIVYYCIKLKDYFQKVEHLRSKIEIDNKQKRKMTK